MNMNIEATADLIMSARHSDNFDHEACVKILRDNQSVDDARNLESERFFGQHIREAVAALRPLKEWWIERQKGGDASCGASSQNSHPVQSNAAPTVQPAGAAQPKPESWRDIAEDAWNDLANCACSIGSAGEIAIILTAIERSHAAQPQRRSDDRPVTKAGTPTFGFSVHFDDAHAELDAERQRREQDIEQLYGVARKWEDKALSALAAMEKHNNLFKDKDTDEKLRLAGRIEVDLSALRKHDAELLREVVRLLGSIFLKNGKSLLGGSPPPIWTPRLIAQIAADNVERSDDEVRKPLVDLLELAWGIIANAGGGDWEKEADEWQVAAVKWGASFHDALANVEVRKPVVDDLKLVSTELVHVCEALKSSGFRLRPETQEALARVKP